MTPHAMQLDPQLNDRFQKATLPNLDVNPVKILLVEDDPAVLEELCDVIFLEGWFPIAAASVEEALILLDDAHDIRVVITDVHFAGGDDCANGIQFVSRARAMFGDRGMTYIVLSGDPDTVTASKMEGAFKFLSKPLEPDHLITTVQQAIANEEPFTGDVISINGERL